MCSGRQHRPVAVVAAGRCPAPGITITRLSDELGRGGDRNELGRRAARVQQSTAAIRRGGGRRQVRRSGAHVWSVEHPTAIAPAELSRRGRRRRGQRRLGLEVGEDPVPAA